MNPQKTKGFSESEAARAFAFAACQPVSKASQHPAPEELEVFLKGYRHEAVATTVGISANIDLAVQDEFCTRRLGQFRVKGRRDATVVRELLGPVSSTVLPEWAGMYAQALAAFEDGEREEAKRLFQQTIHSRLEGDSPPKFFLEALERASGREDGVVEMGEK